MKLLVSSHDTMHFIFNILQSEICDFCSFLGTFAGK